jgi:hypothetical protein
MGEKLEFMSRLFTFNGLIIKPTHTSSHRDQGRDAFGVFKCEIDSNLTTTGDTNDTSSLNPEMFEKVEDILSMGEFSGFSAGFTKTTGIIPDDPVVLAEEIKLVIPHAAIGDSGMNE